MRDKGLDKGLIREFDDSERSKRGWSEGFFGFRKMFRDYLTKLHVAFFDPCCPALTGDIYPVRYNAETAVLERYNGTNWVSINVDTGGSYPEGAQEVIAAGAPSATISLNSYLTTISSDAGGDAHTLPDASVVGLRKKIRMGTDGGGNVVIAAPGITGGQITFNDAGDYVDLIWNGSEWIVLENSGATIP